MYPRLCDVEELQQLREFFRQWYGSRWEQRLQQDAGLKHDDINGTIAGYKHLKNGMLPALRVLRRRILGQGMGLAKPPRAPRARRARAIKEVLSDSA